MFWPQIIRGAAIILPVAADPFGVGTLVETQVRMQRSLQSHAQSMVARLAFALIDTVLYDESSITRMPFEPGFCGDVRPQEPLDWTQDCSRADYRFANANAEAHVAANDRKGCLCVERQ